MKKTKITTIQYEGECPRCHRKQSSGKLSEVDTLCYECHKKDENELKIFIEKEFDENIVGGKILSFNRNYNEIIIQGKNGIDYKVEYESESGYEGSSYVLSQINRVQFDGKRYIPV